MQIVSDTESASNLAAMVRKGVKTTSPEVNAGDGKIDLCKTLVAEMDPQVY